MGKLIPEGIRSLSPRELEILQLLGKGLTQLAIGRKVDLKTTTVTSYSARLKEKLGIGTQAELIAFGGRHHREIAAYMACCEESW
jgi:DNA-binding NarL/FixJ family response regulator